MARGTATCGHRRHDHELPGKLFRQPRVVGIGDGDDLSLCCADTGIAASRWPIGVS